MRHTAHNLPTCDPLEPRLLMSGDLPPAGFLAPDDIPGAVTTDSLYQVTATTPSHYQDLLFSGRRISVGHKITRDSIAHAWQFTAQSSGRVIAYLRGFRSNLDGYLQVLDGDGNVVAENDNAVGTGALVNFWVEAGQSHTLRCMAARDHVGRYKLTMAFRADDYSDNTNDAFQVDLDPNLLLRGTVNSRADRDYFTVTPTTSGQLQVDMASFRSRLDSGLIVYDANMNLLTANNNASRYTRNSRVNLSVNAGQTYYVLALGVGRNRTGDYRILFQLQTDDIGNTWNDAAAVNLQGDGSGTTTGEINYSGDVDAMTFIAPSDGLMTVTTQPTGDRGVQAILSVFDSNHDRLGNANAQTSQFRVTAGQTYYLLVQADRSGDRGTYQVSFTTADSLPIPQGDTPQPGSSIRTDVVTVGDKLVFRVIGTNGADHLTVSQSGANYIVNGVSYAGGGATHVAIYGFGGSDRIRTTYSITSTLAIWGGACNDAIYENARGSSTIAGGDGDDLIVTLGGGTDELHGQAGFDTTWYDSTDSLADLDAAENQANANHRVGQFWQPWTSDSGSGDYVSLSINGQSLRDPSLAGYATGYANFAHRDLFNNGPQYNDINQGALGDCYYLASLSTIAHQNPGVIEQMITPLGDGTYAVRYFGSAGQEVYLRIDGDLPVRNGSLIYAQGTPTGEIWVSLMEKAYAFYRRGQNSYASIEGGWMTEAYADLTDGNTASYYNGSYAPTTVARIIRTALQHGYAITAGSWWGISGPIIGGHAYLVGRIDNNNNVTVYNPWGVDGTSNGSNPSDGVIKISISQFMQYFSYTQLCTL